MDKTYTIIPDFMLDYDLTMTEIVALAVIYGFCQDGKSDFHGSYGYLARKCKCSRQWAIELVSSLVKKGYLAKDIETINGVKICHLHTKIGSQESLLPVNKVDKGSQESLPGGSQESLPNNKDIENKKIIKRGSSFSPPSLSEVQTFWSEKSFSSDPDLFWAHYTNCGWRLSGGRGAKMKDWRLAAIQWEKRENNFKYGR